MGEVGLSYNANSPFGATTNLVSNENVNFYTAANAEFSNLDKEKGANNPLITGAIAVAIVAGKVIWKVASKASSKIFTNGGKNALKKETKNDIINSFNSLKDGKSRGVKTVKNEQELNNLWETFTQNAKETKIIEKPNGNKIIQKKLNDGTLLQFRGSSKSGGATIDIFKPGVSPRKIHIGD